MKRIGWAPGTGSGNVMAVGGDSMTDERISWRPGEFGDVQLVLNDFRNPEADIYDGDWFFIKDASDVPAVITASGGRPFHEHLVIVIPVDVIRSLHWRRFADVRHTGYKAFLRVSRQLSSPQLDAIPSGLVQEQEHKFTLRTAARLCENASPGDGG